MIAGAMEGRKMLGRLKNLGIVAVCSGAVALLASLYLGCDAQGSISSSSQSQSAASSEAASTFTYLGKDLPKNIETKIGGSNYSLYNPERGVVAVRQIRYLNKAACTSVKVSKNILPDDCVCIDGFLIADQNGDEEYDVCSHVQTLSCVDVEDGDLNMTDSACQNRFKTIFNKIARAYERDELAEWGVPEAASYSPLSVEDICEHIGEKKGLMNWKREKFVSQFNTHLSEVRAQGLIRNEDGMYFEVANPKILQGPGCLIYGRYEKITKKNDSVLDGEVCGFGYRMDPFEKDFTVLKADDECNTDLKGLVEELKALF
jgi:hypothetical protein